MKIKNIPLILILILMMSGVFTGCNAVNSAFDSVFLNAPDVRAKDLAGYEGAEPESSVFSLKQVSDMVQVMNQ